MPGASPTAAHPRRLHSPPHCGSGSTGEQLLPPRPHGALSVTPVARKVQRVQEAALETLLETFSTETLLQVHRRFHTGERPYPCPDCGKAFRPLLQHTEHRCMHIDKPPSSRPDLGKSYCSFSNLWKHRKTHQQQLAEAEAAVGLAVMETAMEVLPLVAAIEIYPLAEAEGVQISG
ncbi:hypothetical protein P7K49_020995 [Saguinus oedipus]|uniref:C2H2-type domain-containing protein n=1 Tax=Saguinus oedipus TaxID=9490 RepID=A0ABQ9URD6_SAGOE|nr:hypothetical protein P7K49_020995 [Saguinus oedipus]